MFACGFLQDLYISLCTDQFETSTSRLPAHTPGIWLCIVPGEGTFERCVGRVGNLNVIYLSFWRNTPVSFFRFLQGLTDLQGGSAFVSE